MKYTIKITGSGTRVQIEHALRQLANNLDPEKQNFTDEELEDAQWEDHVLMTEITRE